jgi:hypothetical protein
MQAERIRSILVFSFFQKFRLPSPIKRENENQKKGKLTYSYLHKGISDCPQTHHTKNIVRLV